MTVARDGRLRVLAAETGAASRWLDRDSSSECASGEWMVEPSTWLEVASRAIARSRSSGEPKTRARPWRWHRRPLAAGDWLGAYRLLERLGRGGQGDVWKALKHGPSAVLVAIKVLRPDLAVRPSRMAQFRREAERGARLAGPSLLTVTELGHCDGYHFMVMPYVQGVTLREIIRARAAVRQGCPVEEGHRLVTLDDPDYVLTITRILAEATEGLARAHALHIAHRDVKPANILLDYSSPEGVYLCDFGLARDLQVATTRQMRDGAGTPMYMAPERLLRADADEIRCDIFSMGVTLFEALTLTRPFLVPATLAPPALPAFLATTRRRRPGEIRPGFPRDLEAIIVRATRHRPADRYESADQLAAELRAAERRRLFRHAGKAGDLRGHPLMRGPHAQISGGV